MGIYYEDHPQNTRKDTTMEKLAKYYEANKKEITMGLHSMNLLMNAYQSYGPDSGKKDTKP